MTVFYFKCFDGTREICFTRLLGEVTFPDIDISYWIVPGTLED
jgi:hypothetical protein